MFRLWAKEFKDNRMLQDTVIEVDNDDTRTHKIFHGKYVIDADACLECGTCEAECPTGAISAE